ncbi:Na(+)-translocating NADH-quinone reductase subunit B [Leclercia adecarboxylata]|uniref:Na(+)-translocating NADH-quinone reductase subunit B n=1 Tax=Leclercia adecarboxylata TaxID=83655 RepID=A0A4U9HSD7_9ENTR|nr:Na(+)-translocating NADH-quinone reductase subunit B [Leclercia adecarboxylata]
MIIAKQLYGGLGHNPFNPAMIGYVVLLISFPVQMTSWLPPHEIAATVPGFMDALQIIFSGHTATGADMNSLRMGVDGISQATPLDTFKTSLHAGHSVEQVMQYPIYSGVLAGAGWQWVNLAYLAGGLFMLWQKGDPLAYPGELPGHPGNLFRTGLGLLAGIAGVTATSSALRRDHAGGAFFILTDPVTASTTNRGRLIFGALAGLLVWLIRSFGGYPDGVAFAVLLANITVPLIDYYTRPRVYGHR